MSHHYKIPAVNELTFGLVADWRVYKQKVGDDVQVGKQETQAWQVASIFPGPRVNYSKSINTRF